MTLAMLHYDKSHRFYTFFNPSQVHVAKTQGSYIPTSSDDLPYITICPQPALALFDMPNLNRFDILLISIFCKITISISISISIFLELPCRYRYFSELPYRYRYRYRYFQLLHIDIDIDIDIFQKCRYIDNRYFISIF